MVIRRVFVAIFGAVLAASACYAQTGESDHVTELVKKLHDSSSAPPVLVLAHRSCWWDGAPENSISALHVCEQMGVDGVEVDAVKTADGKLVVMHDTSVDRTTDGKGVIANMTLAQVTALHLRARFGGPYAPITEEHVPSLEEFLRAAKGHFLVHIHLKVPNEEKDVTELVDKLGIGKQVMAWIYGTPGSKRLESYPFYGHLNVVPGVADCAKSPCTLPDLRAYAPYHPVAINVPISNDAFLKALSALPRPKGARLTVGTLYTDKKQDDGWEKDVDAQFNSILDDGVTLIMTNRPAELIKVLEQRHQR